MALPGDRWEQNPNAGKRSACKARPAPPFEAYRALVSSLARQRVCYSRSGGDAYAQHTTSNVAFILGFFVSPR